MVEKITKNGYSSTEAANHVDTSQPDLNLLNRVRDFFPGLHSSYHKLIIEAVENGSFAARNMSCLKSYYDHFAEFADEKYGYKEFASDRFEDILVSVSFLDRDGGLTSDEAIKADARKLCVSEAEDCNLSLRSDLGY